MTTLSINFSWISDQMMRIASLEAAEAVLKCTSSRIDTVVLAMTDLYGRLMGKRFCTQHVLEDNLLRKGTHMCDYMLANDINMDPIPGFKFANYENGYGDVHLAPDVKSLVISEWNRPKSAVFMCDLYDQRGDLVQIAPRNMLKIQIEKMEKEFGMGVHAASELEYYTFAKSFDLANECGYSAKEMKSVSNHVQDYHLLQTNREEWVTGKARSLLRKANIPIEGTKGEAGLGQQEINVKYQDVLTNCDHHVLIKQALKEVADRHGQSVTFMPKPYSNFTGSGFHIHLNLYDLATKTNAFQGEDFQDGSLVASNAFKHFLGGWIAHAPELMAFYAPCVNSYKRFKSASWAPTRLTWSMDNRTAGFRVVGHGKSLRIEFRIPGADANPYLALAASIAAGMDGMKYKIDPPPCFHGNSYESKTTSPLPKNLSEASKLLRNSSFAQNALGSSVVEHYAHFYASEHSAYENAVTDWERTRYFEMI
jgi:glutamine synthetase